MDYSKMSMDKLRELIACPHRDAFRRVPLIDGGLALCPNLRGLNANH